MDALEALETSLRSGESECAEWKEFVPVRAEDWDGKDKFARALVAIANTAAFRGRSRGFLFAGVRSEGELVGVPRNLEYAKVLADIVMSRTRPPVRFDLEYLEPDVLERAFGRRKAQGGILAVAVLPPWGSPHEWLPYLGSASGRILIRRGSGTFEPNVAEIAELRRQIDLGRKRFIKEHEDWIRTYMGSARVIADALRRRKRRHAAQLAYELLLDWKGGLMLNHMQFSGYILLPLIQKRVNPLSLLMTTSGVKGSIKLRGYGVARERRAGIASRRAQVEAWTRVEAAFQTLLNDGPSEGLVGLAESLERRGGIMEGEFDIHALSRALEFQAKAILQEFSISREDAVPFNWYMKSYTPDYQYLPPKGWTPRTQPVWVPGKLVVTRTGRVWRPRLFSGRRFRAEWPVLGDAKEEEQELLWWAVFLDPTVYFQMSIGYESFPMGIGTPPWHAEASKLFHEGKLSIEEYAKTAAQIPGRLNEGPMVLGNIAFTAFSIYVWLQSGSPWLLMGPTLVWGMYASFKVWDFRRERSRVEAEVSK